MYSLHCYPMWGNSKYPQQTSSEDDGQKHNVWEKLIEQWKPNDHKLLKCARSMTKYGPIPDSLRPEAWFVISGAAELLKNNQGLYTKLYTTESPHSDLIEKDLPRTWGNHPSFHSRTGSQNCLRRILIAYSNFDPSLGYCQGMNYIAGFLLHVFKGSNEEQAFWTFVVILRQIRSLFIDGLPGFHKVVYYFRKLCAYHLPKLHAKWESFGIDVYKLILTPWFHSLFSYPCLDLSYTSRIWDLFIIHDFSVLIKISFAIIATNERKLIKKDFVEIIDFCKFLPCMKHGGKQLIQKSISLQLNSKYLNPTKDLTQFDWQINKALKSEFIKHKKRRLRKERKKKLIEEKYKKLNLSYKKNKNDEKKQLQLDLNDNNTEDDNISNLSGISTSYSTISCSGGNSTIYPSSNSNLSNEL